GSTVPAGAVSGAEEVCAAGSGSGGGPAARTAPLPRFAGVLTLTSKSCWGWATVTVALACFCSSAVSAVSVVPAVPSAPPLGSFSSIRADSRQSPRGRPRLVEPLPPLARTVVAVSAPVVFAHLRAKSSSFARVPRRGRRVRALRGRGRPRSQFRASGWVGVSIRSERIGDPAGLLVQRPLRQPGHHRR